MADPKKKREMYLSFRCDEEKIQRIDEIAKQRGIAVFGDPAAVDRSMIARQAIDEFLARTPAVVAPAVDDYPNSSPAV